MKICFIGDCGHAFQTYNEMKMCEEAEFVGVAPASEHDDIEALKKYEIPIFDSYEKMIKDALPDIAVISPVFGLTGRIIQYCAKRKLDIFAEKPIASNLTELVSVEKAIRENNVHFSAMHFLRFHPSFYHAQKQVDGGAIGEVRMITAQKSYKYGIRPEWYKERELYTGTIPWVGIHAIDWISFIAKKKFRSVRALHCGNPEMVALCQFELEEDVIASINIDYMRPQTAMTHGDDRLRVVGSKGVIEVFSDKYVLINEEGIQEYRPTEAPKLAYDYLLRKEEISPEEIFEITRVALCTRESADTHKVIENLTGM